MCFFGRWCNPPLLAYGVLRWKQQAAMRNFRAGRFGHICETVYFVLAHGQLYVAFTKPIARLASRQVPASFSLHSSVKESILVYITVTRQIPPDRGVTWCIRISFRPNKVQQCITIELSP